jgi:hypothetical protein
MRETARLFHMGLFSALERACLEAGEVMPRERRGGLLLGLDGGSAVWITRDLLPSLIWI